MARMTGPGLQGPSAFMPESYTESDQAADDAADMPRMSARGRMPEPQGDGNGSGRDGLKGAHDSLPSGTPGRRVHGPAADVSGIVAQLTGHTR